MARGYGLCAVANRVWTAVRDEAIVQSDRIGAVMKTILIPTEDHDTMPAVLQAAQLVAGIFGSYMEGFAIRPAIGTYVTVEPVSSLALSGAFEEDTTRQAQELFDKFMREHDVPRTVSEL